MDNFTQTIIKKLKAGKKVSALIASRWSGCPSTKLTSRISDLRASGYKIKSEWRRTQQGKRYMEYSL